MRARAIHRDWIETMMDCHVKRNVGDDWIPVACKFKSPEIRRFVENPRQRTKEIG